MPDEPQPERSLQSVAATYANGAERPLKGFVGLLATYGSLVTGLTVAVRRSGRQPPSQVNWSDLAVMCIATHKIARVIAKDPVTSPLRAPFTRFEGQSGEAEVSEEVRGEGWRKAVGELVTCPFCIGQWVATGLAFGFVLAPRATRLAAETFVALTAADFLQFAYDALQS